MARQLEIGGRYVGEGQPAFVVAEIGINHNGELETAKRIIDAAKLAGCDAVKFQKRTPELCVPPAQRDLIRETPWGPMTYMNYRRRIEFASEEYDEIDRYCRDRQLIWFASPWDEPSVDFLERYDPPCYKIPSAALTDDDLIRRMRETGKPLILSTGMSTMEQIRTAVEVVGRKNLLIAHCTSTYPCRPEELNLRMILTLRDEFDCPVGYSGHEVGLQTTYAAVVLGACFIERHATLDRAMWGSDQAASVEPSGLGRLVRDIRTIEQALGDGQKRVYDSELPVLQKLRRKN
ncbi:N-acetylneuraminate synthase family protein [Singulisphaera sp. Ch08]|uniref:N-acetylneuraminate synthase family protein n=1 Tax=Singulisphaera sp. Ch08 TaxID=3120278 RepID=A0AAU7CPT7_9BACT